LLPSLVQPYPAPRLHQHRFYRHVRALQPVPERNVLRSGKPVVHVPLQGGQLLDLPIGPELSIMLDMSFRESHRRSSLLASVASAAGLSEGCFRHVKRLIQTRDQSQAARVVHQRMLSQEVAGRSDGSGGFPEVFHRLFEHSVFVSHRLTVQYVVRGVRCPMSPRPAGRSSTVYLREGTFHVLG
jgi:hypothetical protein